MSDAEASRRLRQDGPNALPDRRALGWMRLLWNIVTEPMFVMLLIATAIYAAIGDAGEAALLLGSVAIVMLITVVQEFRTQGALRALRELAAPAAHVVREGVERSLPATDIVRGDVLVLREGDRVPADGVLLDDVVMLDESLLTGEAAAVRHTPSARCDIKAGTLVVAGHGHMETTATGSATALGMIGVSLASSEETPSPLQRKAARAIRVLALIAMAFAAAVACLGWGWSGLDPLDAALAGIALAMAILPEEVPVVLTVFYALGARRIARRDVLTRRLAAVETMGAVSVLAVDKTGTLTQNRMALARLMDATGRVHDAGGVLEDSALDVLHAAWEATAPSSMDPTDAAVRALAEAVPRLAGAGAAAAPALREFPLGDGRMFVSRVVAVAGQAAWHLATKGAIEDVLPLCRLDRDVAAGLAAKAMDLAGEGYRVLAVARSAPTSGAPPADPSVEPHTLVGMIALADPLRTDVPAAMAECRAAGIRVLMLTGDHPATAAAIARQAGLRGENLLTGAEIAGLGDAALDARLRDVDACARVLPAQKLRLVRSLQRQGHVVGMTGDGVNDAPALRAADVGVAMGARGSDVARESADLILLNDSFASLVMSIRLGRRIYDNVHGAVRFISAAHVPIVILALVPLLMQRSPLLLPAQIVLLEMIIDPACSIVFEATPAAENVMRRPPRSIDDSPFGAAILARGLVDGAGAGAVLALAYVALVLAAVPAAEAALTVFLSLFACVVAFVVAGQRSVVDRIVGTPWTYALLLFAAAVVMAVAFLPGVHDLMGFAEPGWSTAFVPPACVLLTIAWLRWPVAAMAIQRRWRSTVHADHFRYRPSPVTPRRPIHEDPDSYRR
nr:HAD-IC family P-type ATPase [Luteibacter yeojuensis]